MSNHKNQHKLWDYPWAYVESFLIYSGILITGFLMEIFFPLKTTTGIIFPYNLFILIAIVALIISFHLFFKNQVFVKWLGSVHAAIMSIIFIFLMVMMMGILTSCIPSATDPSVQDSNNTSNNNYRKCR